jgi:hypothetical protein
MEYYTTFDPEARSRSDSRNFNGTDGAGCRDRTRDPMITNHVLYQLS